MTSLEFFFLRHLQRPKYVVAESEELAIIVMIVSVVNCVILSAHDRLRITPHCIVDVCGPNSREKEKQYVSEIMHRKEEYACDIWRRLKNTIKRVERNRSPGCQRRWLVIFVM